MFFYYISRNFIDEKDKKKWLKVMIIDIMSSDESCDGNISVKALKQFLPKIGQGGKQNKTDQARGQTKVRMMGVSHSERPKPRGLPTWATNKE